MQTSKEALIAQQLVLFHLGFYKGLIDGIWSDKAIDAKKKFESDRSFLPAFPNGGLPFGSRDKLPKGMIYRNGLVCHRDLPDEKIAEILKAMEARTEKPAEPASAAASEAEPTASQVEDTTSESEGSDEGNSSADSASDTGVASKNDHDRHKHRKGNHHHNHKRG